MQAPESSETTRHFTVCVPTRGRGDSIARTLVSLAGMTYENFDVIVVDQSEDSRTNDAMRSAVGDDPRFRYIQSQTVGLSVARNLAIGAASGSFIAFTDDDCEVSSDWLACIDSHFRDHPEVGMICGEVREGPHDAFAGYIPSFYLREPHIVSSPWVKWRARGIGANMAFRANVLKSVGPFDEVLGAGGPLYSCEDGDMTYRVLRSRASVMNVKDAYVVHHGFRDWQEAQVVMRRALLSVGAACVKHVRLGDMAILPTLIYIWFGRCISWRNLVLLRRNPGIGRFLFYGYGMLLSFKYGIDRPSRTYVLRRPKIPEREPLAQVADKI
jgi:glycosyltransferase involved in cell wall biosynthesis